MFARFARLSSITHNTNQFKIENRRLKRFFNSKGANFAACFAPLKYILPPISPKKDSGAGAATVRKELLQSCHHLRLQIIYEPFTTKEACMHLLNLLVTQSC